MPLGAGDDACRISGTPPGSRDVLVLYRHPLPPPSPWRSTPRPSPSAVAAAQRAFDAGLPRRVAAASSASANTRASASAQATTPRSTHQHAPDDAHTARSPLRAPDAGVARRQVAAASSIVACIDHGTRAALRARRRRRRDQQNMERCAHPQ